MPYAQRRAAPIHWEVEGSGPAVLLVQGLGYPGAMWYRMTPYLADAYRVITFDNRGVGATGVPPGPYSIETMADDAAAVLDAAGERSAHVVGASMGGFIAQELCLRRPERVRSLVLCCTHCGGAEAVQPSGDALGMLAARATMTPVEAAEVAIPFVYAPDTDRARIDQDIAVRMRQPTTPEGYANQLQGIMRHQGTFARLPQIGVPALVMHGTIDRLVDPANAPILAEGIPDARLVLLDGASHIMFTDRTDEAGKALRGFLDDMAAR